MATRSHDIPTPAERRQEREKIAQKIVTESRGNQRKALKLLAEQLSPPLGHSELLVSLFAMAERLLPRSGEFEIIVSDETSGRIPSLIFQDILNRQRSKINKDPLVISFLLGGRISKVQARAVQNFVAIPPKSLAEKLRQPLIVTEYVDRGLSLQAFLNTFYRQGISPVVAAVSVREDPAFYRFIFEKNPSQPSGKKTLNDLFIVGDSLEHEGGWGVFFRDNPLGSGVVKGGKEKSPHPASVLQSTATLNKEEIRAKIKKSRDEAALVAEVFARLLKL